MFHSPQASWAVLTGAGEQGACWILTGGTFEQLEDSERTGSTVDQYQPVVTFSVSRVLDW
jgi:hypothetical protein